MNTQKPKKIIIVGGVAGGASTAARLRRQDEHANIIMLEKGLYISFANCGLPYYIGGVIEKREALLVQTPEAMSQRFNIDIRTQNEVVSINKAAQEVTILNHQIGTTYTETYDTLVLSPGSVPLKPPIPGIDAPNIFTLWDIPDTDAIASYVHTKKPKRAAVIGGGFIGLEMVENLHHLGIEVSLVEMANQVMAPIDFELAQAVHKHIQSKGVDLYLRNGVASFAYNEKNETTTVTLQGGETLEVDMVMLSIGIKPQTHIAQEAGLTLNSRGGIVVDATLKTSDPHIYAIGDAAEIIDFNSTQGGKTMVPLAGPANKQGRICANNIACDRAEGGDELHKDSMSAEAEAEQNHKVYTYKGTQGTSVAKVFDLTVASTGVNEKTLQQAGKVRGKDYQAVIIHPGSHAGYYPGASKLSLKLLFALTGEVLGAQGVGSDGVTKRIDVLATALRFHATVTDLTELELAYAPPYSSAKDPVNMLGFVAENILNQKVQVVHWDESESWHNPDTMLLDVRTSTEHQRGHIAGALHIPVDELRDRLQELDTNKKIIVYCAVGIRGYIAARILMQHGFSSVYNLSGGYTTYSCVYGERNG